MTFPSSVAWSSCSFPTPRRHFIWNMKWNGEFKARNCPFFHMIFFLKPWCAWKWKWERERERKIFPPIEMDILLGTNCQSCCKMKPVTHFPAWIFLLLFCLALIFFFKTNGTKQKWHDHIKRKIIKKNVSLSLFFFAIEVSRPFTAVKSLKHSSKTCKKNENGESWGKNEICDASRQL